MGLFGKREKTVYEKITYRIYMNQTGKAEDKPAECLEILDDSEFLAIRAAEKRYPRLKAARVERIDRPDPEIS